MSLRGLRAGCAVIAGEGFLVLCAGLVVGEGWLRVPGLGLFVLFLAATFAVDWALGRDAYPQVESETAARFDIGEHFDAIEITWPPRIDDRRTA